MPQCKPNETIIHGTTSSGKVFRPSDWSERLCGILSSFDDDNRLSYHQWVTPVVIDNVRSVAVDNRLEEINPPMFRFLMDFAEDNDLRIISGKEAQAAVKEAAAETAEPQPPQETEPAAQAQEDGSVLREIPPEETATAFAALSVLRSSLTDINRFVNQVNTVQRPQGYRMIGIFEEGRHNASAVCGFHEACNLASGRHMFIDDIVTIAQSRNRGYASRLLAEVRRIAAADGIKHIHLNVHVNHDRSPAHRLYFRNGFEISAYHFRCKTDYNGS